MAALIERRRNCVMKEERPSILVETRWSLKWKTLSSFSFSVPSNLCKMRIQNILIVTAAAILLSGLSFGVITTFPRFLLLFLTSVGVYSENNVSLTGMPHDCVHGNEGSCHKSGYSSNEWCKGNIQSTDSPTSSAEKDDSIYKKSSTFYDTSISIRYKQRFPAGKDVKREAVAAMNIALDLQNQGKTEKAMKIFQHAVALDPSHSDILTAFGEFLEWHVKDIVKADHMYHVALENCPEHGRALQNRERTGPIVEEIDQALFSRIDQKRSLLYTIPHHHPGLRRAKKEAYFAHIYHTNAIEGNTLTLAQTRSIVETRIAVGGKSLREQNEVLGLDSALSFINSTLVGRIGRLTLQDILDIHIRVLGFVDPTEAGRFRANQVYVGDFIPPAAGELKDLMDQLVEWLNSEEASNLHPIEFAALAHYRLVTIHPFYDGNGRTSRLLMNLILMQAGFPPVSIEVNDRLTYYETLEQGNKGDIRPFIRFIAKCAERTLDGYLFVTMEDYELTLPSSHRTRASGSKDRVIYVDNELYEDGDSVNSSSEEDGGS
ncbi:protein adenylyltransferase FICD [Aplysia californica]|uniref:protein adenylyltransferase n=1 Tax=Aplysia californica TaxID=6500 RepID=A0ABM0K574_APLCA|nr:protein adenylyltransferase FICD [Aplysia californica]